MKRIGIVLCCLTMFILGACSVGIVSAEQTWPLKIWAQNENGSFSTLCVVDEDTGVNYVVVSRYNGMRGANSIAICPRYNTDGTLYTGD